MEQRIIAQKGAKVNDEDRLALAALLIKFGYTDRQRKERRREDGYYICRVQIIIRAVHKKWQDR